MNLVFFWSDGFKTGFSSLPCTLLYIILICFPFRGESNDEYALLYVFHKEDMKIKQKRKKEIGVNKTGYLWLFIQPAQGQGMNKSWMVMVVSVTLCSFFSVQAIKENINKERKKCNRSLQDKIFNIGHPSSF